MLRLNALGSVLATFASKIKLSSKVSGKFTTALFSQHILKTYEGLNSAEEHCCLFGCSKNCWVSHLTDGSWPESAPGGHLVKMISHSLVKNSKMYPGL